MPVSREGDDHNQHGNHEKAGRFHRIDLRTSIPRVRPALGGGGRHKDIVAPKGMGDGTVQNSEVRMQKAEFRTKNHQLSLPVYF